MTETRVGVRNNGDICLLKRRHNLKHDFGNGESTPKGKK
jgi:hypothetical protein